jgi:hypothetical protein
MPTLLINVRADQHGQRVAHVLLESRSAATPASSCRCSASSASRPPVRCSSSSGSSWPLGFLARATRRGPSELGDPVVASKPQLVGRSTFAAALQQRLVPTSWCVRGGSSSGLVALSMRDVAAGSGGQANELTIPAGSGCALAECSGLDAGSWLPLADTTSGRPMCCCTRTPRRNNAPAQARVPVRPAGSGA